MRILILTFYYRPDLSAGSFRTTAFVERLRELMPSGTTIDILATLPNRYHMFTADAPREEERDGVRVTRVALPPHRSGMRDQSRSFIAFAREAARITAGRQYDIVFATSSRLMTAALGSWIARRAGARLFLDIRDIFVDTITDVMPRRIGRLLQPAFSLIERWTVGHADAVNLVSPGFETYFRSRYPDQRFLFHTNGIDDEFVKASVGPIPSPLNPSFPTVLYAGNLGEGQGMHGILPELARRMQGLARFRVVGDGGRRRVLEAALAASRITNVELIAPMARRQLIQEYLHADVLFLHLNDYPAFEKVLPSKVFEYAAMGKPIWAGVAGYPAQFICSEIENSAVFQPCNVDDALRAFARLRIMTTRRPDFISKYSRASISEAMARDLVALGGAC